MREAYLFQHLARHVEVFANIATMCVRAVTYLATAEFVISFDNISLRRHLVMEVDFEGFAPCDYAVEYGVNLFWKILVSQQLIAIGRAVRDVAYVRNRVVSIRRVEAFQNGFEVSSVHSFFCFLKEREFEVHVVAVHAMHRIYNDVERIFFNGFFVRFLCRLTRIVTRFYAETEV